MLVEQAYLVIVLKVIKQQNEMQNHRNQVTAKARHKVIHLGISQVEKAWEATVHFMVMPMIAISNTGRVVVVEAGVLQGMVVILVKTYMNPMLQVEH